jgi:hypothetical protein
MGASDVGHIYGQNSGLFQPDGIMYPLSATKVANVGDGLSNTVMVVERRESRMAVWIDGGTAAVVARPFDELNAPTYAGLEHALNFTPYFHYTNPKAEYGPSSEHPSGALHLIGDGSIRFLSNTISATTYTALATRSGREDVLNEGF